MASGRTIEVTYPPLDTLKPVADGLWVLDSGPIGAMGLELPVRMTVVRLPSGEMWLHSPTRFTPALKAAIEAVGPIRHLVAPNIAHWTFLKDWQAQCPDAITSAAPKLRERAQVQKAGIRLDRDLADDPPPDWGGVFEQVVVPGGGGFREVAFFHTPSRTLILTDLIENFEANKLPFGTRLFARLAGILAPDGKAPAHLRLVLRLRRQEARAAARRLIAFEPERVIFSHGRWFDRNGAAELRRAFGWLV